MIIVHDEYWELKRQRKALDKYIKVINSNIPKNVIDSPTIPNGSLFELVHSGDIGTIEQCSDYISDLDLIAKLERSNNFEQWINAQDSDNAIKYIVETKRELQTMKELTRVLINELRTIRDLKGAKA